MAAPLNEITQKLLSPTIEKLAKAGATTDHADWIRRPGNAALLVQFIDQRRGMSEKNPYEMTVEEQLAALRLANDEENRIWCTDEIIERLRGTVPPWPKGTHAYRSFRIRFGEGDDGVAQTFEAHCARIKHVFGEGRYWRWGHLHSGKVEYKGIPVERLRLLDGNSTHKACVEWIVADLDTHRHRKSISAVRNSKSLADELLVIAWMFPDMIRDIDYDKLPGLFAAGYEVNVPESDAAAWQGVVYVDLDRGDRQVRVQASGRSSNSSGYSVPTLWDRE